MLNRLKQGMHWIGVTGLTGALSLGMVPATLANPLAPSPNSSQIAQAPGDVNLFERPSYVDTCRSSGATELVVYADTALTRVVGRVPAYRRITLTGVLGTGLAQIKAPLVGWVRTATLLTNCDAGPPVSQVCYQVVADELTVRSSPYGTPINSTVRGDRVFASNPPQRQTTSDGRIWIRVTVRGSTGWIAESGTGGVGRNIVLCP